MIRVLLVDYHAGSVDRLILTGIADALHVAQAQTLVHAKLKPSSRVRHDVHKLPEPAIAPAGLLKSRDDSTAMHDTKSSCRSKKLSLSRASPNKPAMLVDVLVNATYHLAHNRGLTFQLLLGNGVQVHNVRTISKPHMPHVMVQIGQTRILTNAVRTVNLDGLINDLLTHSGGVHFSHCNEGLGILEAVLVRLYCCEIAQEP